MEDLTARYVKSDRRISITSGVRTCVGQDRIFTGNQWVKLCKREGCVKQAQAKMLFCVVNILNPRPLATYQRKRGHPRPTPVGFRGEDDSQHHRSSRTRKSAKCKVCLVMYSSRKDTASLKAKKREGLWLGCQVIGLDGSDWLFHGLGWF